MYRPTEPFIYPLWYHTVTTSKVNGVNRKIINPIGVQFFCSFRTYGGTEIKSNDVLVIEDTANIVTWFDPNIKSDTIIKNAEGKTYEILGSPENVDMRNQFLMFKVKAVNGGV